MKKLLTVEDVCNIMQLSEPTVRKLIKLEDFPSIKFGTSIKIPEDKLKEWIDSHTGTKVLI